MEIVDLGHKTVTVELTQEDIDWLRMGARIGGAAARGYAILKDAAGPKVGISADESGKRYDRLHNLLSAMYTAIEDDEEPVL